MKKQEQVQYVGKKMYNVYVEYKGRDDEKERKFAKAAGRHESGGGFFFGNGGVSDMSWTFFQKPAAERVYKRLKDFKAKSKMRFKLKFAVDIVPVEKKK